MSTITVQGVATDASGVGLPEAWVRIALVTSGGPGYTSSGEIVTPGSVQTDATGHWSTNLVPNSQITPANTYYQVTENGAVSNIVVPASGGPYLVGSILATPPPTPSAPGITGVQVAANGTVDSVRPEVNLIAGAGITVTVVDNAAANRADVTLVSTGGASPATTVQPGTSFGVASAVGTDLTYAREDHQHGTPPLASSAPATTEGIGQAAATGTATSAARADHVHPLAASGTPGASAVGDTASNGSAATFAASDHVHGRESFGAVSALAAFGVASANGSAATVSHSDHVHGAPALPTATTGAAGIVQLDGTATDIKALGTQAAGSTGKAADASHVHPTTGLVTSVAAGDNSIVVGGSAGAPTLETATLDVIAALHAAVADWSNNGHKITSLGNGSNPGDAAAFGQIPVVGLLTDIIQSAVAKAAGASGRFADAAHSHGRDAWDASDHGFLAWTFDPIECSSSGASPGSAGQLQLTKIHIPVAITVTNVCLWVVTAGTSLTSGENFAGLFTAAGSLVGATADQTSAWGTTGLKTMPLTASQAIAAGDYYIGFFYNGSGTVPQFARASSGIGINNVNLSAANSRFATGSSGNTTAMPATAGSIAAQTNANWGAVS